MTRLMPYPLLGAGLFVMWLLLTQSFSLGQVLLGALVAFMVVQSTVRLAPTRSKPRDFGAMVRLLGMVLVDVIRSNFAVMRIALYPQGQRVSGFVRLPLDLRDPFGLTVLALILTATPGTMWVEYNRARSELLVHVLDLVDEAEWCRLIKQRYETLLQRIFEP
ncbi:Na+/H+ antiporter subunit E [Altererythrobacter aerius]|uniref:Na+/H+ antiporter subunit E n=1 Tax=Tsuneonella aeria TaxID=1837929 RepID=A0A6I4TBR3_9SPHN|nr:Na+/H+ antiporter subunit E [Tsuneonella aeria]MXO74969.1 Na+/H+ antiporter subunit E [Tsuneonella aeria]